MNPIIQIAPAGIFFCVFITIIFLIIFMVVVKTHDDKLKVLKGVYIYIVSIGSLAVLLIGIAIGLYNFLGHTVFPKAIEGSYSNYKMNCEYLKDPSYYANAPVKVVDKQAIELTQAEKQKQYDDCNKHAIEEMKNQMEVDNQMSYLMSLIMILISLPVFIIHYIILRRKL